MIALASAVTVFVQRVLQARVSDYEYFAIGALPAIATTLLLVVFVLFVPNVTDYLILQTVLTVATMVWALLRLRQRVDMRLIKPYAALDYLRRAAPTGMSMIGSILVLRGDLTILGLRSTEDQVGQYSMAGAIAGLLFLVCEVFALRAVSAHRAVEADAYPSVVAGLARTAVLAVALVALPLIGVSWVVLTYLLPDFWPAFWPTVILAIAAVASAYTRVMAGGLGMVAGVAGCCGRRRRAQRRSPKPQARNSGTGVERRRPHVPQPSWSCARRCRSGAACRRTHRSGGSVRQRQVHVGGSHSGPPGTDARNHEAGSGARGAVVAGCNRPRRHRA